jgi:hypothetical protein
LLARAAVDGRRHIETHRVELLAHGVGHLARHDDQVA